MHLISLDDSSISLSMVTYVQIMLAFTMADKVESWSHDRNFADISRKGFRKPRERGGNSSERKIL